MSKLNRRIATANRSKSDPRPTVDVVSETIERFASHLANRGAWTKCGFIPRHQNGRTKTASELQSNDIVEFNETESPLDSSRGFIVPDIRLSKVLGAADKLGSEEGLYLSEDGLLCHYNLVTGTATPCLEIDGTYAFREDYAVPFRGKTIGWDELEKGIENLGTGRG